MRIPQYPELVGTPQPEALRHDPRQIVREGFLELCENRHILGAFPFGSVYTDTYSPLSDLDIVVATEELNVDEETEMLEAIHKKSQELYQQTHLPLEISLYSQAKLKTGRHDFPYQMVNYLYQQRALRGEDTIGWDFITEIEPQQRASERNLPRPYIFFATADEYIDKLRSRLTKQWLQGVYSNPHDLLSSVLDIPHIATRKIVDPLQTAGVVAELFSDLTHESLYKAGADFLDGFPEALREEARLAKALFDMLTHDNVQFVTSLWPEVQKGAITTEEFDQIIIATLEQDIPVAIQFLRRFKELYSKLGWDSGYHHQSVGLC